MASIDHPAAAAKEQELPPFSRPLFEWFMWYVRRYLRRHFHAVRLLTNAAGPDHPELGDERVIFYSNHPGWWDPLTFLLVGQALYPERMVYGPIDAGALGKYRFLERIGFIGIDPHTWRGAARFLRMMRAAGRRSDVIFWITAQGAFTDPRVRPLEIRPGVGHGIAAAEGGIVVPLAVEYPFWNERLPEAVVAFGPAIRIAATPGRSADDWTRELARELEAVQDRLAAAVQSRDPRRFKTLLAGRVGVGFVYDAVRRLRAWAGGRPFDPSHGGHEPGERAGA